MEVCWSRAASRERRWRTIPQEVWGALLCSEPAQSITHLSGSVARIYCCDYMGTSGIRLGLDDTKREGTIWRQYHMTQVWVNWDGEGKRGCSSWVASESWRGRKLGREWEKIDTEVWRLRIAVFMLLVCSLMRWFPKFCVPLTFQVSI